MSFNFDIRIRTDEGEKWVDGRKVYDYLKSLESGVEKPHSKEKKELFDRWWNLYNHKQDKKTCKKMFLKISINNIEKIMKHTKEYVENTYTNGTYPDRRHPRTYLSKETWENDIIYIKEDEKAIAENFAKEKKEDWNKREYIKTLKLSGKSDAEIDRCLKLYYQK